MLRCLRGALIVLLAAVSAAQAAPPTLISLFPAGGQRGQTVEVTAGGTFARWPMQAWTDRKDVTIQATKSKGKLTVAIAPEAVPGTCWVRLYDEQGASELRPFIIGTLPEVMEQEPNNDAAKPQKLAAQPVVVNGRLDRNGDVDCFAVRLRKGETLVASLEANRTLAAPMDGVLQVLSADGFVLEENNDHHDLDPQLTFTAPKEDAYVVRVYAFPAEPDASIHLSGGEAYLYRLTLTTGGFGAHAFPLAVQRGKEATVEVIGWNIASAAKKLPVKAGATGPVTLWHPQLANTLPVLVEPHPCIVETEPNGRDRPQAVTLPVTISGVIDAPGDVDVYEFPAKKGQRLSFRVDARSVGSLLDPLLRLTDAAGKRLAQADDAANGKVGARAVTLAYTVPQDGRYRLEVRDQGRHGSREHFYQLRAVGPEPDFALTVASDRFTLRPGTPLAIPVTVTRRDGYSQPIDVTVEELPAGVTVKPARSVGAGSSPVTVQLEAKGKPVAGAFRIVGRSAGQVDSLRIATAPRGKMSNTQHLWINVLR